MTKKCLVYAMSPISFIAALSAVETLRGSDRVSVYVLVEWPGSSQITEELAEIIKLFSKEFSFIKKIVSKNMGTFGKIDFDEIYFPHDLIEDTSESLFERYPRAKRICCGDSFGLVYTKEFFFRLLESPVRNKNLIQILKIKIYKILERTKDGPSKRIYETHQATLVLPIDQSGSYFKKVPLTVCPKKIVIDIVNKCSKSCQGLENYIGKILMPYDQKKIYVLLTENFAEANLISLEKEIEMYCFIIRKYCQPNDILFLKPHHGETLPRGQKIIARLSDYRIFELKKNFIKYPIEIWQGLLDNALIISAGYPVLSLKYLYNIDVIQPMDKTLIKNWFPERPQVYLKDAINIYNESLKRLNHWNGRTPLYVKKYTYNKFWFKK